MRKATPDISDEVKLNEAHNKKMQKIKEARDKMMGSKTEEKALSLFILEPAKANHHQALA